MMRVFYKVGNVFNLKLQQRLFSSYCNISDSKFNKFCSHLLKIKSDVDLKNEDHKWPMNLLQELGGNKHIALEKLSSIAENCNEYVQLSKDLAKVNKLSVESFEGELLQTVQEDSKIISSKIQTEKDSIVSQILQSCEVEDTDGFMIEIIPRVGGIEASLFANELLDMYENFILNNGYEFQPVVMERNNRGYLMKAIVVCKPGNMYHGNLYHLLRHEAGTHRVERVPETEYFGRKYIIKAMTAVVSVIPKHISNFGDLKDKDIKKSFSCSEDPSGQHANTTGTKVTLTHIPTGITVTNCDTTAQIDNFNGAMEELTYKVNQLNIQAKNKKINTARFQHLTQMKTQVSRSGKVRTYNFPYQIITDHRFDVQASQTDLYFNGGSHFYRFLKRIDEKWEESEQQQVLLQLVDEVNLFNYTPTTKKQ